MRTSPDRVSRVAVVGGGIIGASWTALFLSHGIAVHVIDPAPTAPAAVRRFIRDAWPTLESLWGAADTDPDAVTFATTPDGALDNVEFIQECAPERSRLKRDLFAELDRVAPPEVVIASSSSSLLVSDFQSSCRHPERCVLGHPFNPPHLVPLVEVVGGAQTDPSAVDWAMAFYTAIGKHPIRLRREISGCIANRLARAVWREAVHLIDQDIANVQAIDDAMRFGPGLRWAIMGPFLTYHLAGGAGGIEQFFAHFGGGLQSAWNDLGQPTLTNELTRRIITQVKTATADRPTTEIEAWRDHCLLEMLAALARCPE